MHALKNQIVETVRAFEREDMGVCSSGNISARLDNHILITPSGVHPKDLTEEHIVTLSLTGEVLDAMYTPSSEWHFHCDLYQSSEQIKAIVHVHSPYAVAQSCLAKPIPAFHYMIAKVGGACIPCADYATFGSEELSANILQSMHGYHGCLVANHGQVATGVSVDTAYNMAKEIEALSRQYTLACSVGEPVLLSKEEMMINVEKFKTYGKAHRTEKN